MVLIQHQIICDLSADLGFYKMLQPFHMLDLDCLKQCFDMIRLI